MITSSEGLQHWICCMHCIQSQFDVQPQFDAKLQHHYSITHIMAMLGTHDNTEGEK